MITSPLEQFEIHSIIPIRLLGIDISITNSTVFGALVVATILGIGWMSSSQSTIVPSRWQSLVEMIYEFVFGILYDTVGEKGVRFFPLVFCVFTFVLISNLVGMVPYSFTITSHMAVTFAIGFSIFVGITIIGFIEHGLHYFSLLKPEGAPVAMLPFLVAVEFISYVIRPFSLSIRLFANMMAGHSLLKIIGGFSYSMFGMGGIMTLIGILPVLILCVLVGLELAIACIQAYVFTLLLCSYLNDAINLH